MESLKAAHAKIEGQGGLKKTTGDVQETIDLLMSAREAIASSKRLQRFETGYQ